MAFLNKTACLFIIILPIALLLAPSQGYSYNALDIFYSNDVSGKTEPCG